MYCMSNFIISEARRRRGGVGMTAEEELLAFNGSGKKVPRHPRLSLTGDLQRWTVTRTAVLPFSLQPHVDTRVPRVSVCRRLSAS